MNFWSLRLESCRTNNAYTDTDTRMTWMVFDYITINDEFCLCVVTFFSFLFRVLTKTKIDYSFRNEWELRNTRKTIIYCARTNISPFNSTTRFFFFFFLCYDRMLCNAVWMYQMFFFFQIFGRTKVLIEAPLHPNYVYFYFFSECSESKWFSTKKKKQNKKMEREKLVHMRCASAWE